LDKSKRLEWFARGLVIGVLLGMVAFIVAARLRAQAGVVEIHGVMSEGGGWTPAGLTARVGAPLRLRLVADDVVHGFAVGQQDWPAIDLYPGRPVETELIFDRPGKYTFYCTRWCGPNHWRMRGVIEVEGLDPHPPATPVRPLYVALGLNLDAPHPAAALPPRQPQAAQGEKLLTQVPQQYRSREYHQAHSPAQAWSDLRQERSLAALDDAQIWDLVAALWFQQTTPAALQEGASLYAENCAACHGETGAGDGVMAGQLAAAGAPGTQTPHQPGSAAGHAATAPPSLAVSGHTTTAPTDFTDSGQMLGASPALLHGKIVRGGMGTGMPYWGPIFTDEQIWSLVAYLWTFQFDYP
jgi:mono/diheme cytochrome c family protein/plastocyanin